MTPYFTTFSLSHLAIFYGLLRNRNYFHLLCGFSTKVHLGMVYGDAKEREYRNRELCLKWTRSNCLLCCEIPTRDLLHPYLYCVC